MVLKLTESDFSQQIEDLLKMFGWRWTHFRAAWSVKGYRTPIKGDKGFPDYVAVRPPRLLFIEAKSEKGKTSPKQKEWLEALMETPIEVYIWRPADFDDIVELLR